MNARFEGLRSDAQHSVALTAQALDAGNPELAEQHLQQALALQPQHPEVLRMQAGLHGLRGRYSQAIATMRAAIAQRPNDAVYYITLGSLLGGAGDYDNAIDALQTCCRLNPKLVDAWYNLGVLLVRSVRNEEAVEALQKAVMLAPEHASARSLLADLLRTKGRADEAAAMFRQVLQQQPWSGMAWWGLADLKTVPFERTDIERMQQALRHPSASNDDRMAIGFALARALDEAGDYAHSLNALQQANALGRQRQQWDRAGFSRSVDQHLAVFKPTPKGSDQPLGGEVIFVVGLPRSGSTLVEQILASHSEVGGAGELVDLPQTLAEESRRRGIPFPQWVPHMQPADWHRLGQRYLQRTQSWRGQRARFVDKLPSNWLYIGAIRAMLPEAHIVGCRRAPLETTFSCYRQRLDNNEYSRTFEDLAAFWRDYDRALQHLHALHPQHVYEHSYEMLLHDPQDAIARLLAFCGLDFQDSCMRFHESSREVRSPSASQVRRPLQRDTAHSERYGSLLDPLRLALGLRPWEAPAKASEATTDKS
jgi:tetratricopeptide (TPR) repeat protein